MLTRRGLLATASGAAIAAALPGLTLNAPIRAGMVLHLDGGTYDVRWLAQLVGSVWHPLNDSQEAADYAAKLNADPQSTRLARAA